MVKRVASAQIQKLMLAVFGLIMFAGVNTSWANAAAGMDWLALQAQSDGQVSTSGDVAMSFQATSEAIRALIGIEGSGHPAVSAALSFVMAEPFESTESLARKLIAKRAAGEPMDGLIATLLTHQNPDGGFSDQLGYARVA